MINKRVKGKKKKKLSKLKIYLLMTLVLIIVLVLGIRHHIYSVCKQYDKTIFPGITIETVDVGGKTKQEAINLLNEKYGNKVLKKNIVIKALDKNYKINYSQLNAKYNIPEVVDNAFKYGKDKKVIEKYKIIKKAKNKKYTLKFEYDDKYINVLLNEIKKDVDTKPQDATIKKVGDESFSTTPSKNGKSLKVDKLKKDINSSINGKINKKEAVIKAEIDVVKPKIQQEQLNSINSRITSFSTTFNNSGASQNRAYNIKLASNAIDGTLIMPGNIFSFNNVVGERSKAKGYKGAPIIVGNKVQDGLGGGVCQVSTTLYNAALRANLPSVERVNHTMPSSYVDKGLDATVSYGSIDYKFKNTLKYPVYIESYIRGNTLVCSIYSNRALNDTKYDFVSEVYETVPSRTIYVNDSSLSRGTEIIDSSSKTGYKVNVYKITYKNGTQVSKELLYKDYYRQVNGVIRRGTR